MTETARAGPPAATSAGGSARVDGVAGVAASPGAWTPPGTPAVLAILPRFPLLDGPSPLRRLDRLSAVLRDRADLWIKREDLLPWAFGGNKLRNLEFIVGAALAAGADTLVTTGRRWSNHARLTAAAGARAGLAVHLVLSGPPTEPPNPGLGLARRLGAIVHQARTDRREEREALVATVVADLESAGARPFVVPLGGSGIPGAVGQLLAGLELAGQAGDLRLEIDRVVVPVSTGGTQAGLIAGLALATGRDRTAGPAGTVPPRVVGVAVGGVVERLAGEVGQLATSLLELAGGPAGLPPIELDVAFLGQGYALPTPAATEAAELLARTEAILVDPIYTAKALAALIATVQTGELDGRTAVFWHAGGLPGLFEPLPIPADELVAAAPPIAPPRPARKCG